LVVDFTAEGQALLDAGSVELPVPWVARSQVRRPASTPPRPETLAELSSVGREVIAVTVRLSDDLTIATPVPAVTMTNTAGELQLATEALREGLSIRGQVVLEHRVLDLEGILSFRDLAGELWTALDRGLLFERPRARAGR
jgi:hypothetical protein